jgi:hypothetical protein
MSEKPIAERLQVKLGRRLAVIGAPAEVDAVIGVLQQRAAAAEADVLLLFLDSRAALDATLADVSPNLRENVILWLAYPKLSSSLAGDLNRDVIRAAAPAHGLAPVSQVAIDKDWSALRLTRLASRSGQVREVWGRRDA